MLDQLEKSNTMLLVVILWTIAFQGISCLTSLQQRMLDKHNELRSQEANQKNAANMKKLTWDSALESHAANWARTCGMQHSTSSYGENLYWVTKHTYSEMDVVNIGTQAWYDEDKLWYWGKGFTSETGHYTQVVWATTDKLGCSVNLCAPNGNFGDRSFYMYACNYKPAGNYFPDSNSGPYIRGKACSQCGGGGCDQGLCTGGSGGTSGGSGGNIGGSDTNTGNSGWNTGGNTGSNNNDDNNNDWNSNDYWGNYGGSDNYWDNNNNDYWGDGWGNNWGDYGGSNNNWDDYGGSNNNWGDYGGSNNNWDDYGGSNNNWGDYGGSNNNWGDYGGSNNNWNNNNDYWGTNDYGGWDNNDWWWKRGRQDLKRRDQNGNKAALNNPTAIGKAKRLMRDDNKHISTMEQKAAVSEQVKRNLTQTKAEDGMKKHSFDKNLMSQSPAVRQQALKHLRYLKAKRRLLTERQLFNQGRSGQPKQSELKQKFGRESKKHQTASLTNGVTNDETGLNDQNMETRNKEAKENRLLSELKSIMQRKRSDDVGNTKNNE